MVKPITVGILAVVAIIVVAMSVAGWALFYTPMQATTIDKTSTKQTPQPAIQTDYNFSAIPVDLHLKQLLPRHEEYSKSAVYEDYRTMHNLAMWCYREDYQGIDWQQYDGPRHDGSTCQAISKDVQNMCEGKAGVINDYYDFRTDYNKDWICNDDVILRFS